MSTILFLSPRIDDKKSYVNLSYYQLFKNQDVIPIILPYIMDKKKLLQILKMGNGLILCGGIDINPKYFQKKYQKSVYIDALDQYDFLLLELAIQLKMPVFGICRGLQVINVYFHGSLTEHIENHMQTNHKIFFSNKDENIFNHFHDVEMVNSFHHQSILDLGHHLICCAKSQDGVIEAIYSKKYPIYAIQWHCELLTNKKRQYQMILSFFKQCKQHRFKKDNS